MAIIIKSYEKKNQNEVNLVEKDYIHVLRHYDNGWGAGLTMLGETGFFPLNRTQSVTSAHNRRADSAVVKSLQISHSGSLSLPSIYRSSK